LFTSGLEHFVHFRFGTDCFAQDRVPDLFEVVLDVLNDTVCRDMLKDIEGTNAISSNFLDRSNLL
jgi:hypothetical protein